LPVALKAIKAGEMAASMAQDPARMGSEGVELAVKVVQGETVPEFIPIDGVLITADNVDEYLTE
jgi:ribose transport system substrate-binding protein